MSALVTDAEAADLARACDDFARSDRTESDVRRLGRLMAKAAPRLLADRAERVQREAGERAHWNCPTHGPGRAEAWGCPDCVAFLRREVEGLRSLIDQIVQAARAAESPEDMLYAVEQAARRAARERP